MYFCMYGKHVYVGVGEFVCLYVCWCNSVYKCVRFVCVSFKKFEIYKREQWKHSTNDVITNSAQKYGDDNN